MLELGRTLDVPLPGQANAEQQGWIAEMTDAPARCIEFDRVFANRLRAAHGGVYKFLAVVRTRTRNTLIRDFAKRCMKVALDHIQVLEATGMVDFTDTEAIPLATVATAPAPPLPRTRSCPTSAARRTSRGSRTDPVATPLLGLLVVSVILGVYLWVGGQGRREAGASRPDDPHLAR